MSYAACGGRDGRASPGPGDGRCQPHRQSGAQTGAVLGIHVQIFEQAMRPNYVHMFTYVIGSV